MKALVESLLKAGWAPTLVFSLHMILWKVVGAYEAFPRLDTPMHILGGLAIAFYFWKTYWIYAREGAFGQINSTAVGLLTLTSAVASTVLWEFAEFLSDRYLGTNTQKGLEDTLLDMLLGIVGGAVFVCVAWFQARKRRPHYGG